MATSLKKTMKNLNWFNRKPRIKIPKKQQAYFLKSIATLLQEGFSLIQALNFMKILLAKQTPALDHMMTLLGKGGQFDQALFDLGFSLACRSQVYYAQKQGRFNQGLLKAGQHIDLIHNYQKKLIQSLIYPLIMFAFLIGLLFLMRSFLLPHITSFISQELFDSNILVKSLISFFAYLPQLFLGSLGLILVSIGMLTYYFRRFAYLEQLRRLSKFPLLGHWVIKYASYKFTRELAYFYEGGYSLQQTLTFLLKYPIDPLMTHLAHHLEVGFKSGRDLATLLKECLIFAEDLPYVIHHAELTSQLASQCQLYSQKTFDDLLADISQKIAYVQPILFLIIAGLVLAMYLMMMLPMLTFDGF
ncbi:competence type IV pilus assembly protein ComGB [Eremococcus coleocola]|uniref:Bacterial type II secretion system domain protein F n=1 Tax=Eremococcus coleocola ACS-139-V-Col8 TaxID=908337 RepID=E4KNK1_9LACT|nr:competence type IV pilus assembly protein ComGB [Eremococcus coleocola]EFR31512.1 bacterial type II secretion system domain protein F [Eremococcus coleocola ACS-139-V-Col8]